MRDTENQGLMSAIDYAYMHLKDGILRGVYPPGSKIDITKVAEQLSISRTPVREAVMRLAYDGVVDVHPRRHTVVSQISAKDLFDLYTVRIQLEMIACPFIIENITDKDIQKLEQLLEKSVVAEPHDHDGIKRTSRAFHEILYKATNNKYLSRVMTELLDASWRYIRSSWEINKSLVGHKEIIEALKKRDTEALKAAVERDLGQTKQVVDAFLRKEGKPRT